MDHHGQDDAHSGEPGPGSHRAEGAVGSTDGGYRVSADASAARRLLAGLFERSHVLSWMNDPTLPWNRHRTRADAACLWAIVLTTALDAVYTAAQPSILAGSPVLSACLGDKVGVVLTGSLASTGSPWWPLALLVGSVMTIKFAWVYWWAGRLWGREVLDVFVREKSEKARRRYERFWELAHRYASPVLVLSSTPAPVPGRPVHAAVGAARMSLARFATLSIVTGAVVNLGYLAFGWWLGAPAVGLLDSYGRRYLPMLTGVLVVGMVLVALVACLRARRGSVATA